MFLGDRRLRDDTLYRIQQDWTHTIAVLLEFERTVDIGTEGPFLGA
jgi:hypothetical protein